MATKRKRPIELLTPEEVGALLQACPTSPSGLRNRALIATIYYSGIRSAEALDLLPRDLDLDQGSINIRNGKGSRQRIVGLNPLANGHIARWQRRRDRLNVNGRRRIFCTISSGQATGFGEGGELRAGGKLSDSYFRRVLRDLAVQVGIEKRVHPHSLRHSFAARLAEKGVPMHQIQRQLGHSSLATTGAYLDSIAPIETIEAVRSLDW